MRLGIEERDRFFEDESQRLRRERDDARLTLQWYTALMVGYGFGFGKGWENRALEILRPLWPAGPQSPLTFLWAVRDKVKRAHGWHPDDCICSKCTGLPT